MEKTRHTARCATVAITAALAFGSTALAAQSAVPSDGLPSTAPPPIAQPAPSTAQPSVVSGATASPISQQPVVVPNAQPSATPVQIAPPAAAPVRPSVTKPATRTAAAPKSAINAPAPVNSAPAETTNSTPATPVNTDLSLQDSAQVAPAAPIAPIAAPAPVQPERADGSNAMVWTGLGLLILAALAVIGFFSFRRRKPARAVVPVVERPRVEPRTQPMPTASAAATAPAMAFAAERPAAVQTAISPRPVAYTSPRNGGAVQLPKEMPRTFEERDALLKRMVDAAPDRANPFRSRRARLHRARLILQSLGTRFEDRDPWIDLSQYPDNWPEVARRKFSHAA